MTHFNRTSKHKKIKKTRKPAKKIPKEMAQMGGRERLREVETWHFLAISIFFLINMYFWFVVYFKALTFCYFLLCFLFSDYELFTWCFCTFSICGY